MKKCVIFDFDGVLINTIDLAFSIHKKYNAQLTKDFFDQLHIGNFHENYRKAVLEGKLVEVPDFYEKFLDGMLLINTEEVIHKLGVDLASKYQLFVVSSTNSDVISRKLVSDFLRSYFTDILGADMHTSKIVKINSILADYALNKEDVVFVTDTTGDVQEGHSCGVASIAVTWGVHKREDFEPMKPFAIVDDAAELEQVITSFLK